jgi:hypothetical protein
LRISWVLFAAVLLLSCDSNHRLPLDVSESAKGLTGPATAQIGHYDLDEEWARIARDVVPGFAGFYRSASGDYVVLTSRPEYEQAARELVEQVADALGRARIVTRGAIVKYDFYDLNSWKRALVPLIDDVDVYWLDIDEVRNLLVLGVRSVDVRTDVMAAARVLNIPEDAVDVQQTVKPVPRSSLTDRIRPVLAGLRIRSAAGPCTFGFNALSNGTRGFVTASHCSTHRFGTDGTVQYQPTITHANRIGAETNDPSGQRRSDAAFYTMDPGTSGDVGFIARTTYSAVNQPGSLLINPSHPRFRITGKVPNGVQVFGELVNKVGATSGWTQGQVVQTCVTLGPLPCQWVALVWSEHGDSGSPMFQQNGPHEPLAGEVGLWGILWGGPPGDWTTTWYSPISGVEHDLGVLTVEPPPAPPPAVAIVGPYEVQQHVHCTWTSNLSGGVSPFTYEWRRDGSVVGTDSHYTTWDTGTTDFLLELRVWDAYWRMGFSYRTVTVEGAGQVDCEW